MAKRMGLTISLITVFLMFADAWSNGDEGAPGAPGAPSIWSHAAKTGIGTAYEEYFDKQWQQFKKGAAEQDINEEKAYEIWSKINTMGSWAFNRSHAVSYGLISYWCAALKGKYPLEFA
ncbi:hypothetical protein IH922_09650, partial [candidate division KSB1 bacterium]|nr:hypothetical protein [candidate division KSB1 bacterium]